MELIIGIAVGLALGALVTWLVMRGKVSIANTILEERTSALEQRSQELMAEQQRRHDEAMTAQQQRFNETIEKVTAQMKDATGEMLRQRQKEFQEASAGSIGQLVTPLRETIDKMQRTMAETQTRQSADSGALKTIIQQMMEKSEQTKRSTDELTRVFRHSNTVQGSWGETVLDELLEGQGLTRGVHYDTQATIRDASGTAVTTEEGARLRPDVILHLDQRREVIIDSKVSLAAYMDYVNADTEADRQRFLAAHIASIKDQVNNLARKDYSAYIQPPKVKMDYVIMFVPNTGALWTAINAQPDLWRRSMERGVYIADEQTLFAALRIVSLTWTQIAQAQNHEKVFALASEMMDRVGQFMKKYQAIGTALQKAQQAFDDGDRKLQPTGQSILQTCAKLQRLGAKPSDKNPLPQLTDIDEIEALTAPEEGSSQTASEENV
ncbi:MAG: DNA recombination protein RmuC [Bacteroidaceae bacterium]|nr:DNA recombination protein RmuC [Bacteroidaceae bacterium]